MLISILKTKTNQMALEHVTFNDALKHLNKMMDSADYGTVLEALILQPRGYVDSKFPDFRSCCDIVASLRTIK